MIGHEHQSQWTAERVALLTRLWREGQPSSFIGRRLGITPAAVCSKAERLGLAPRRPSQNEGRQELARAVQKPTLAGSGWSCKDVETLKAMAEQGHSASQIAEPLGTTRNAVIGKASRLGVRLKGNTPKCSRDGKQVSTPPASRSVPRPAPRVDNVVHPPRPAAAPPPPPPAMVRPVPAVSQGPLTIDELTHASCRWPIDPEGEHGWRFCGQPRHPKSQLSCYCKEHFLRSVGRMPRQRAWRAA